MVVVALSFEPLRNGVKTRNDALYVLGFPADGNPDSDTVNARFRMLATIHHPDGAYGDHGRMSQLNQAVAKPAKRRGIVAAQVSSKCRLGVVVLVDDQIENRSRLGGVLTESGEQFLQRRPHFP